jgi:hypothetical protein
VGIFWLAISSGQISARISTLTYLGTLTAVKYRRLFQTRSYPKFHHKGVITSKELFSNFSTYLFKHCLGVLSVMSLGLPESSEQHNLHWIS